MLYKVPLWRLETLFRHNPGLRVYIPRHPGKAFALDDVGETTVCLKAPGTCVQFRLVQCIDLEEVRGETRVTLFHGLRGGGFRTSTLRVCPAEEVRTRV